MTTLPLRASDLPNVPFVWPTFARVAAAIDDGRRRVRRGRAAGQRRPQAAGHPLSGERYGAPATASRSIARASSLPSSMR